MKLSVTAPGHRAYDLSGRTEAIVGEQLSFAAEHGAVSFTIDRSPAGAKVEIIGGTVSVDRPGLYRLVAAFTVGGASQVVTLVAFPAAVLKFYGFEPKSHSHTRKDPRLILRSVARHMARDEDALVLERPGPMPANFYLGDRESGGLLQGSLQAHGA